MIYSDDFVDIVVARLSSSEISARELERVLRVPRKTISRWLKRKIAGKPARSKPIPKNVQNKTSISVLNQIKQLLEAGKSSIHAWIELKRIVCLRTIQRYKAEWFPPKPKPKVIVRRYERRKALSLLHTDWATKRIKDGKRCCFSFYVDDASRKLFALHAYPRATLENTIHNFKLAKKQAKYFKQVLSDNGRVYMKNYDAELIGIKHLRTRVHNPKCNGKAEALVKKVKRFLKQFVVRDIAHANKLLKRYQNEYNRTPHTSLNYQTPNQVFKNKQKAVEA
mgnify:CR=1 FL=1